MKKNKQSIEDYRITPLEETHSEWILDQIKSRHPNAIFVQERWNQKIDWEGIEKQAKHIEILSAYLEENKLPPLLYKTYLDLLHTNLQILRDIFFVNTGFYLDIKEGGELKEKEDFKKLRFWTLRDIEATTRLRELFEGFLRCKCLRGFLDDEDNYWNEVEEKLRGAYSEEEITRVIGQETFRNSKFWSMTYALAPYENREGVSPLNTEFQKSTVSLYISSFFQLFFELSVIYQTEEQNLPELVEELIHSEYGEYRMKGWRKDMNVSKDEFITKLESVPELKPWVRGVVAVLEEKQHIRSLFSEDGNPHEINIAKCSNIDNWINVVVIAALLKEYDEEQKIVRQLMPFFFFGERDVRDFLNRIRGAEPKMITSLVKKLEEETTLSEYSKTKSLYDVLHKNGLYPLSYQNWHDQLI